MGETPTRDWCDHVFNPWYGCAKVSAGCANCHAAAQANRDPVRFGVWGRTGTRVIAPEAMWREPFKWNRQAQSDGILRRVFCASLADVFEADLTVPSGSVESVRLARLRLFETIRLTPDLTWMLLTKRPESIASLLERLRTDTSVELAAWFDAWLAGSPPANVWLGVSVENQPSADARIPQLFALAAATRFVCFEPALGPVDWSKFPAPALGSLWILVGGEFGRYARPFDLAWALDTVAHCRATGVDCFVKQLGRFPVIPELRRGGAESVVCRQAWPPGSRFGDPTGTARSDGRFALLRDPRGANPTEWPASLRMRQFPRER